MATSAIVSFRGVVKRELSDAGLRTDPYSDHETVLRVRDVSGVLVIVFYIEKYGDGTVRVKYYGDDIKPGVLKYACKAYRHHGDDEKIDTFNTSLIIKLPEDTRKYADEAKNIFKWLVKVCSTGEMTLRKKLLWDKKELKSQYEPRCWILHIQNLAVRGDADLLSPEAKNVEVCGTVFWVQGSNGTRQDDVIINFDENKIFRNVKGEMKELEAENVQPFIQKIREELVE